jgi:hypothetical protein
MEGLMVVIRNRYPAASADGIDAAAQVNGPSDGLDISNVGNGTPTRVFDIVGGSAPECRVSYQEATVSGSVYTAPVIAFVTTGC